MYSGRQFSAWAGLRGQSQHTCSCCCSSRGREVTLLQPRPGCTLACSSTCSWPPLLLLLRHKAAKHCPHKAGCGYKRLCCGQLSLPSASKETAHQGSLSAASRPLLWLQDPPLTRASCKVSRKHWTPPSPCWAALHSPSSWKTCGWPQGRLLVPQVRGCPALERSEYSGRAAAAPHEAQDCFQLPTGHECSGVKTTFLLTADIKMTSHVSAVQLLLQCLQGCLWRSWLSSRSHARVASGPGHWWSAFRRMTLHRQAGSRDMSALR